ncbi:hypothetical protein DF052_27475, partial [Burkholderia glumae]
MSELQANAAPLPVVLTGDRPTGPLHLGHSVGSLRTRLPRQDTRQPTLLSADTQALIDNAHDPDKVRRHALDVALDYLAAGIDPAQSRHASHARRGARRARYVLARHRERAARGRRARRLKRGLGHAAAARKPNPPLPGGRRGVVESGGRRRAGLPRLLRAELLDQRVELGQFGFVQVGE